jgi:predicted membrane protein (TIGR00267 family)
MAQRARLMMECGTPIAPKSEIGRERYDAGKEERGMAVSTRLRGRVRAALSMPETGPTMRRYFVNTIFDSTFVLLGIVIGSAFSEVPNLHVVVVTILTSSVALGISTGVSVFEAETLEQRRRIDEIERALLRSLEDTYIGKSSRSSILLISGVNFLAPVIACGLILAPFLLIAPGDIRTAAWVAVGLAISLLFVVGLFIGRQGNRNPWLGGVRMAAVGLAAFVICFYIESII